LPEEKFVSYLTNHKVTSAYEEENAVEWKDNSKRTLFIALLIIPVLMLIGLVGCLSAVWNSSPSATTSVVVGTGSPSPSPSTEVTESSSPSSSPEPSKTVEPSKTMEPSSKAPVVQPSPTVTRTVEATLEKCQAPVIVPRNEGDKYSGKSAVRALLQGWIWDSYTASSTVLERVEKFGPEQSGTELSNALRSGELTQQLHMHLPNCSNEVAVVDKQFIQLMTNTYDAMQLNKIAVEWISAHNKALAG
jgi:hypothetical protein